MHNYEVGDQVTYRNFFGAAVTGVVTEKDDDIKNGRPGFVMEVPGDEDGAWGYDDQIVSVRPQR